MKNNSTKKKVKKNNTPQIKTRRRTTIFVVAAAMAVLALGGAIAWLKTDAQKTVLHASADTPTFSEFRDNNATILTGDAHIPTVNNNRELNPIRPLYISYAANRSHTPAFKMNITDAEIARAIKITPFIKGKWSVHGGAISFVPDINWPADTKFTVKIAKNLFNDDAKPDTRRISFTTPDISAKIDSFNIYPDGAAPKRIIAAAVVSFNYPVKQANFNSRISMELDGKQIDFSSKFDKFDRTAVITTNPIDITDSVQSVRMKIGRIPAAAGTATTKPANAKVTIEPADNFFRVSDIQTIAADDNDGNAQQLILITTTTGASRVTQWTKNIDAYLLPKFKGDDKTRAHKWEMDEVTDAVIAKSKKLTLDEINFAAPGGIYQYAFAYDAGDGDERYIYVNVHGGIKSAGGFDLKNSAARVMRVPYPEKSVKIAGDGALLSLGGDRKLGIMTRGGIKNAYVNLYKVKASEINHLISQTYNVFSQSMDFKSWAFGAYDMSVVFQKTVPFANASVKRTNYASIDLGDYLDKTGADKTGIFIMQTGITRSNADYNDRRLILLTDLGIIRKINNDGSSVLFVSSLSKGTPAPSVEISVLGRNGNPIWTGKTNTDGRVDIPRFAWSEYKNAREPVAFVARQGNDVSFIPYDGTFDTRVEYSKFETDGAYSSSVIPMNAYIFTDRGIYRPGENMIIGGIVKNKSFAELAGVPVKLEIEDARGRTIFERTFSLVADGMFDIKYDISATAPIGDWTARVYSLNTKNKQQDILGTANFRVEEFVPDNLKITAKISNSRDAGWISPEQITADVSLRNLFGTPAADRMITARAVLTPATFSFDKYKQYRFTENFISGTGLSDNSMARPQQITIDLPNTYTDENGMAKMPIKFDGDIGNGTYVLNLTVNGGNGENGNSVRTTISTRVAAAKYLVGFHADSDLSYINKNAVRRVNLIALDATATPIAVNGLTKKLIRRENLTSLVKDYSGYYKYQTVTRDRVISQTGLNIKKDGTKIDIDTKNSGTYFLQILDPDENIMANIEYFVAGTENNALTADKTAELELKLNASDYNAGDEITVDITAPYAGAGLITIERDRVYAYKWFRANGTHTSQKIKIPAGFEGTGYINVSFVRDINSRDVFTTPYAYAVAPFRANVSKRNISIKLSAPDVVRDNKLVIKYETNKSARIMIFAVNTGILQVAKYKTPNPIAHFFQKAALQVETYQILSLLLPEYKVLREFAKTGGGDYDGGAGELGAPLTNPFGRRVNAPVAFYSGIINTTANKAGTVEFDIPQYFNGAITVFAVAANDASMGAAETDTLVQSPVIISLATPTKATPGDKFEVNAIISNMTERSGADAMVNATVRANTPISIDGNASTELAIPQGTEKLWTFGANVGDMLGGTAISVAARVMKNGKQLATRTSDATISIRPITTFETNVKTDILKSKSETIKKFACDMYTDKENMQLFVSANASVLMRPLFEYLKTYDYNCSEQLVSRALPYALAGDDMILGTTRTESAQQISKFINELQNRQNPNGSFNMWPGVNTTPGETTAYITAYAAHFMTIARENGFNVPKNMLSRAIDYLREYAGENIRNESDAAAKAFAIYVITRNEYVTTGYIDSFEEYANKNIKNWESKLMGSYIAASYKMLKQTAHADKLFAKYKKTGERRFEYYGTFDTSAANDAIYSYLSRKYFGANAFDIDSIREYINSGEFSTFTSAMAILGLSGDTPKESDTPKISVIANGSAIDGSIKSGTFTANIPHGTDKIEIKCDTCARDLQLFYTIIQSGFPRTARAAENGLEIVREYFDTAGNRVTHGAIGDMITVKISVRARGSSEIVPNVVITDLLPGGLTPLELSGDVDFYEIREDRILLFMTATRTPREITYTAQLTAAGQFAIAPIHAASMYNPAINATGKTGEMFSVSNATN